MGEEDSNATVDPTASKTSSLDKPLEAMDGKENAGGKETQEPKKDEDSAQAEKMEVDEVKVTIDEGQAEVKTMEENADRKKEPTDGGEMEEKMESKDNNNVDENQETKEENITEADHNKAGKESEEDVKHEGEKANGTKCGNSGDIKEEGKLVDDDKGTKEVEKVENEKVEQGKDVDTEENKTDEVDAAKAEVDEGKIEEVKEGSEDEHDNEKIENTHAKEDDKEERDDDKKDEKVESDYDKEDEKAESKGSNKRGKGKTSGGKEAEPRTPFSDRPVRERKSVERLVALIDTESSKEFHIEKGQGACLKDIPNVAYKVTRGKSDETLKLLHTILFGGRRGKAAQIKTNILGFSGFVWHGNEERAKQKVKEKFDKYNKEKLWEFCDVFDIHITKATTKKEEIIIKLIEFLEKPHVTSDVPAYEKEKSSKGAKRKRTPKKNSPAAGSSSSKRSSKSQRKSEEGMKGVKKNLSHSDDESEEEKEKEEEEEEEKHESEQKAEEEKENENGIPDKSEDEAPQPSESEEKDESEEHSEEETTKKKHGSRLSAGKKESAGRASNKKAAVAAISSPPEKVTQKRSSAKRKKTDDDSDTSPKASSKRKKSEKVTKASSAPSKSASKEKPAKKAGKVKDKTNKLSDKVLKNAIVDILKRVDFSSATFTDILKELAKEFKEDLTPRKSSIKLMIQSELTKLTEEADEEDVGKEKAGGSGCGEEVKA